jgi:hypothetical protein
MADILENVSKDKKFSAFDVLEDKITHLICRLHDFKEVACDTDEKKAIIESVRNDLFGIRMAIYNIGNEIEGSNGS